MLVPDDTVLQLTEKKSPYEEGVHGYKRNIGLKEKGLTSNGVMNNRPGKIKELYPPHQTKILTTKDIEVEDKKQVNDRHNQLIPEGKIDLSQFDFSDISTPLGIPIDGILNKIGLQVSEQ